MKTARWRPLVWPLSLLVAAGLTAGLAEATAYSLDTAPLYGMIKLVSDLVLAISVTWLMLAMIDILLRRRIRRSHPPGV